MFDVLVIGGGVIGGAILRELTRFGLRACMLEKNSDVAEGASKANSGIVHAGFDAKPNSLKAKFNVLGNKMMEDYARVLGVKFIRNGSLVVAFSEEEKASIFELKKRGEQNGVQGLTVLDKDELLELEPNISKDAICALFAPSGGIISPYKLTIAQIGNAMDNGAELRCDFEVNEVETSKNGYVLRSTDGREEEGRVIINCAGAGSQRIAELFGDYSFKIGFRRGEYLLLDKEQCGFVKSTLFFAPTKKGKGILVSPTVDGNIILGPTADETEFLDISTTPEGLDEVKQKSKVMTPSVSLGAAITSFSGSRAYCDRHDFIIEESKIAKGVIHCAGIESPGLTSAPAIGKYVVKELVGRYFSLVERKDFVPTRVSDDFFSKLSIEEKNEIIKKDQTYGRIVCRCEQISEGEILRALRVNPKARTIDGVKRRTRSGMGRCQGGFCQPQILELIAKENNLPLTAIRKSGLGSEVLTEVTK